MNMVRTRFGKMPLKDLTMERKRVEEFEETLMYRLWVNQSCFSWLKWVATKSPVQAAKTLKDKSLKNFSKCFSRLEGIPARESRVEPRKSLSNPRDWTFHSRTSHQKWPAKTQLRLATWLNRDWAVKTRQNRIFENFIFFKQNTFQKHLKHSKNFLCLN